MIKRNFIKGIIISLALASSSMVATVSIPNTVIESQAAAAKINQKKLKLEIGESQKLSVSGVSSIKWTSKDTSVAVVSSDGTVTGVGAGSTKVIGKSGKNKFKCKVTVKKAEGQKTDLFDGGKGTVSDPYKLSTVEQLKKIGSFNGMCFKLTKDIDGNYQTIDAPFDSKNAFTGTFDGNGHTISNISLNNSLIGYVGQTGVIKDLTMTKAVVSKKGHGGIGAIASSVEGEISGCTVSDSTISGQANAGFISGNVSSSANILNCTVSGCSITGAAASNWGGISGYNAGRIINCSVKDITVDNTVRYWDAKSSGGIAGANAGNIVNCHVTGSVVIHSAEHESEHDGNYSGDIAGTNEGVVSQCSSSTGNKLVGKGNAAVN